MKSVSLWVLWISILQDTTHSTIINMWSSSPLAICIYRCCTSVDTRVTLFLLYIRDPSVSTEIVLTQPTTPYQIEFPDYRAELVARLIPVHYLTRTWSLLKWNRKPSEANITRRQSWESVTEWWRICLVRSKGNCGSLLNPITGLIDCFHWL